ncbi:hypothetical protein Q5P01_020692 [Channa striata]|uniref:Ig-like domain-containing protein n=1 Tax=Channa striata TaxID=64152 RepID=A0AA88S2F4_CHASR|nr:hypothetical protein Q5P01_020692 [Channa striata]
MLKIEAGPKLRPSVSLLPPSSEQVSGGSATLACLLSGYSPQGAVASWEVDGAEVTEGGPEQLRGGEERPLQQQQHLTLNQENWMRGEVYSCKVLHHDHSQVQSVHRSQCGNQRS